jgi:hypothetical protein
MGCWNGGILGLRWTSFKNNTSQEMKKVVDRKNINRGGKRHPQPSAFALIFGGLQAAEVRREKTGKGYQKNQFDPMNGTNRIEATN